MSGHFDDFAPVRYVEKDEVIMTQAERAAEFDRWTADQVARQRELDAAIAEVAMRAANPQDVNRLVAAAIRLRAALLGGQDR